MICISICLQVTLFFLLQFQVCYWAPPVIFFFFLISGNILFKSMISAWFLFIHSLYQIPSWCDFVSISSFIFLIMVAFKPVNTFIMSTLKSDNWFFHRSVCVCVYDTHTLMYFYSGIWVVFSSFFLCPYNFLLETRHVR